jgi:DNA-directed RNA polymerase specialized sigma24 family protein
MELDPSSEPPSELERLPVTGQLEALGVLYRRCAAILRPFARRRLRQAQIPEADYSDEDLIQSSYGSLAEDIIIDKITSIEGADELLKMLRRIMIDKVMAARDRMNALKRGGAGVQRRHGKGPDSEPPNHAPRPRDPVQSLDDFSLSHSGLSRDEVQGIFSDTVVELLRLLDNKHQRVALMRVKGHTIAEIAEEMRVTTRTIDRRLQAIRVIWSQSGLLDRD